MNRRDAIKATALFTGFAVSGSVVSALLQGCNAPAPVADWAPAFFTADEAKQLMAIADTILPATSTPSATEVGVHQYIDLLVQQAFEAEDQARFKAGLTAFSEAAAQANGKAFHELAAPEQLSYLTTVDTAAKAAAEAMADKPLAEGEDPADREPFFLNLKSLVVGAYFSSQKIATEVLAYDPIPGQYIACAPLAEVSGGKAWAL